jgi:hypothetical protein
MMKSRRMRWTGYVARMGERRNAYRLLVGKPEGMNHWEDQDVGGWMDLVEVEWDDVDWIGLAQNRDRWTALVNSVLTFGFHTMLGRGLSSSAQLHGVNYCPLNEILFAQLSTALVHDA